MSTTKDPINTDTAKAAPSSKPAIEVICCLEQDGEYSFVYRLRSKIFENGSLRSTMRTMPIPKSKQEMRITISWPEEPEKGYDYTENIVDKVIKLPKRVWAGRNLPGPLGSFREMFVLREGSNI